MNIRDTEEYRKYRVQYPNALSFQHPDSKVSLEYMLKEFNLEKLIEQCNNELESKRKHWIPLIDSTYRSDAKVRIPDAVSLNFQPASLMEHRKERRQILESMSQIPLPESVKLQADLLRDEVNPQI